MEMVHKYLYPTSSKFYSTKIKWTYSPITASWYTEDLYTPKAKELVKEYLKLRQQKLFPIWA